MHWAGVRSNRTAMTRSVKVVCATILLSIACRQAPPVTSLITRTMVAASSLGKSIRAVAA